jgi:hypothetical protein
MATGETNCYYVKFFKMMDAIEHTCEECGTEFLCVDEANDDYRNRCSTCYKKMIQEDYDEDYGYSD